MQPSSASWHVETSACGSTCAAALLPTSPACCLRLPLPPVADRPALRPSRLRPAPTYPNLPHTPVLLHQLWSHRLLGAGSHRPGRLGALFCNQTFLSAKPGRLSSIILAKTDMCLRKIMNHHQKICWVSSKRNTQLGYPLSAFS